MKTMTIEKALQQIKDYAANPLGEMRFVEEIEIGQAIRQGDLYAIRIEEIPEDAVKVETNQLVAGTSLGSRHTVGEGVEVFKGTNYGQVIIVSHKPKEVGYVVGYMTRSADRFPNDHPEHAHNSLPAGCYQWIQQLDTRTMKAVQD